MSAIDTKPAIDEISDDAVPATERPLHAKPAPPPLVAAMSPEYRLEAETKLRKKIDTRLLPMIILMYIMNYLDRNNIAAVRLAGLQDELKLTSTQYQVSLLLLPQPLVLVITLAPEENICIAKRVLMITDYCLDPVRWLHSHASAIQSNSEQNRETSTFPPHLHDYMGNHFRCDRCLPKLWRSPSMPILSWFYRSCLLPRMSVLPIVLVHKERAWLPHGSLVLGIPNFRSFRWLDHRRDYE